MKNYFEHRGSAQQLVFDPISKQFTTQPVAHPFLSQPDPLTLHLLADIGIEANALQRGELRLAA